MLGAEFSLLSLGTLCSGEALLLFVMELIIKSNKVPRILSMKYMPGSEPLC